MSDESVVWVIQEQPNLDYRQAEPWGEVRFMTAREYKPLAHSLLNEEIKETVQNKVDTGFDPLRDWVVLTGNPVILGWAVHCLLEKAKRHNETTTKEECEYLQLLQHDKHYGGYRETRLWLEPRT